LYDTDKFDLLPGCWLWKRKGEWILEIDERSDPGIYRLEEKKGSDVIEEMQKILGEKWENRLEVLVTLKTTQLHLSAHRWTDFTSWARWKIGYYAVVTLSDSSPCDFTELEKLSQNKTLSSIPSKGMACLHHIIPTNFEQFFSKTI
jgi:hypothetical protein